MAGIIFSLWQYRHFIYTSIYNETVSRFARSKLGGLWMIINPLSQVAIYALILSNVLAAKLPGIDNKYAYPIYLMAGLLVWTLFTEIITRCLTIFIENGELMKKMQFPRITLPAIVLGINMLNISILFVAMLFIFRLLGHTFSLSMLWAIPLLAILACFAMGIGMILGIINVFVRDIGQTIPITLQIWFWFTPIVYPISIIPEKYQFLLSYNPIYHFTHAFQGILVYGTAPNPTNFIIICISSLLLMLLGLMLFRRANADMVDVL